MSRWYRKKIGDTHNVSYRRYVAVGESISDSSSAVIGVIWGGWFYFLYNPRRADIVAIFLRLPLPFSAVFAGWWGYRPSLSLTSHTMLYPIFLQWYFSLRYLIRVIFRVIYLLFLVVFYYFYAYFNISGHKENRLSTSFDANKRFRTGRGDGTWTHGLCVPNAALYQTEPHLEIPL